MPPPSVIVTYGLSFDNKITDLQNQANPSSFPKLISNSPHSAKSSHSATQWRSATTTAEQSHVLPPPPLPFLSHVLSLSLSLKLINLFFFFFFFYSSSFLAQSLTLSNYDWSLHALAPPLVAIIDDVRGFIFSVSIFSSQDASILVLKSI